MRRDSVEFSVASLEKVEGTLGYSDCLLVYGGLERPGDFSNLCEYNVVGKAERLTDTMKHPAIYQSTMYDSIHKQHITAIHNI